MTDKIKGLPEHICLCFKVCVATLGRKNADRNKHSVIMPWGKQILIRAKPLRGQGVLLPLAYDPPGPIRLAASGSLNNFRAAIDFNLMFIAPAIFSASRLDSSFRSNCAGITGVWVTP